MASKIVSTRPAVFEFEWSFVVILDSRIKGATPQSFQLVGFSLGAHVSGFAGKRLQQTTGKIARIVGLDPAGPLFEDALPGGRLSKGDANFVMTVHGSADGVKNGGLGIWQQIGDADCKTNQSSSFSRTDVMNLLHRNLRFTSSLRERWEVSNLQLGASDHYCSRIKRYVTLSGLSQDVVI